MASTGLMPATRTPLFPAVRLLAATPGGDGSLDSGAIAAPRGLSLPARPRRPGRTHGRQPADHRSMSDDTPSACRPCLMASGQALTGLAG